MMQDVEDEPLFCERVAGLDIAKAMVEVAIRVPSDNTAGRRQQETRTFGTIRRELESLGDWLACWGVSRVGMEATGDYWKPVFFLLESRGFDCQLYNASQVKALPGRPKTDLLTELREGLWLVGGQFASRVATVPDHDHGRGRAAGSVAAGGAAARVA
jgi:transposase